MIKRILLFLILNFSALAIGSLFTSAGVHSDWYANLNKAPWTPPGYVFGIAWSFIMICFSIYMAYVYPLINPKKIIGLYSLQWILNTLWNPTFFYFHLDITGLIIITFLTIVISIFLFKYYSLLKFKSVFITPYFIWLLIATSLNAYIVFNN